MAVDLINYSAKMREEQLAIQEAAAAGLQSMEHLLFHLSSSSSSSSTFVDCREMTDLTVSKFKKVISILHRTGRARFRRGPINTSHHLPPPPPIPPPQLTFDFTKPTSAIPKPEPSLTRSSACQSFSISPPPSTSGNSSFLSSVTADPSVSNGKLSIFSALSNSGKPPLSIPSKPNRCHNHAGSSASGCHCSTRRRKSRVKRTIRVPAISSKIADIPPDDYSWRKYGQKPIKGSPYPRGYYRCSTVKGCPARKHVERAHDDPAMLIVTYEGDHRHTAAAGLAAANTTASMAMAPPLPLPAQEGIPVGTIVFESSR